MVLENDEVFLGFPGILAHIRVKVVVPPVVDLLLALVVNVAVLLI